MDTVNYLCSGIGYRPKVEKHTSVTNEGVGWLSSIPLVLCLLLFCFSPASVGASSSEEDFVEVRGTTLTYIDTGDPDGISDKLPVLFVHGSLGDYRVWNGQVAAFSGDRRVIAYSRRYHHPNPWPENEAVGFSPTIHADDLVAFIEALNIKRLHLVGHSFGGVVALLVARDHGELVETVTLAEPAMVSILGRPAHWKVAKAHAKRMIDPALIALSQGDEVGMVRNFVNGALGGDVFDGFGSGKKGRLFDNARELKGSLLEGANIPPFTCVEARNINIPMLLVTGGHSPEMYRLVSDQLDYCLPDSKLRNIEGANHGLVYDNPHEFNSMLGEFLDHKL